MKDPAFLFYPNDWLGGTMGMTFEQKGAYMELLMLQFNRGHMTSHMIGQILGQSFGQNWDAIKSKFEEDGNGHFFNRRLEEEQMKRKAFTDSRKNNRAGKNQHSKTTTNDGSSDGHTSSLMENENENINNSIVSNYNTINGESFFEIDECAKQAQLDTIWIESVSMNHKIAIIKTKALIDAFSLKLKADGELKKELKDFKQHFNNWLRFELKAKVDHKKTDRMHFEGEKSNVEAIKSKF